MTNNQDTWPAGSTWVFQGTVAEDATGGTHVASLTVTPGAGNEIQVMYGRIMVGNSATAQTAEVLINDGTNTLGHILNGGNAPSATVANLIYPFPQISLAAVPTATNFENMTASGTPIVSGTMQLVLKVTTAAISITQTFAVVCRIKGAMPTATLADAVGAPVLTTNTNKVF